MTPTPLHLVGVETGQSKGSYILGLVLIFVVALVVALVVIKLAYLLPDHPYIKSYTELLTVGTFLPIVLCVANIVHGLSPMMVIAPDRRFDVGMLVRSALVAGGPTLVLAGIGLWAGEISLPQVDWWGLVLLLPVTILVFSLQASAEEVLFRGYMAQGLQRIIGHTWPAMLVGALLFTLAHEGGDQRAVWAMRIEIFMAALFCSWTTLRLGRLEAAMGIHIVNNLLVIWLFAAPHLTLPHLTARTDPDPADIENLVEAAMHVGVFLASIGFYWLVGMRTGFIEGRSPSRQA